MKKLFLWVLVGINVISACKTDITPTEIHPSATLNDRDIETETTTTDSPAQEEYVTITIVYTNDEHGWIAGEEDGSGAAELFGLWKTEFSESDLILPLSGGDNWTGPAISTWFQGESTVEVMNTMGYTASAIGNHEFDFDTEVLTMRMKEANFPYLAANIQTKANGELPTNLRIQPYTFIDVLGLKIGIIGLAFQETPSVTNPLYVANLDFTDYETALREYVPEVRDAGAEIVLVPAHICEWELSSLARDVEDLDITLFGGGHCHELFAEKKADAVLLGGGSNFRSYAFSTFEIHKNTNEVELVAYGTEQNVGGTTHPQVAEIVAYWQELTDQELDVKIGYLENEIEKQSDEMAALITQSWLWAYPADVAITNWGGMRDRIPDGDITISDIISVMPFENVLMDVSLTGEEMEKVLRSGDHLPAIGGLSWDGNQWILVETREPLKPDNVYNLLVTDFMYAGGDNYRIEEFKPDAYNTAINWRQPVIDWIIAQESNQENPLDASIQELIQR